MAEEFYYAPLIDSPVVTIHDVVAQFAMRGRDAKIQEHNPEMCWVFFDGLKSQLVVSTTPDTKKEVGLITLELSDGDGDDVLSAVSDALDALGLSNDPDAQYK